jgi:Flp pilus assembly secretin CpaC
MKRIRTIAAVSVLTACALTAAVAAQQPAPQPPPGAKPATPVAPPLNVQIVLARLQGEKKVSSLPYHMSLSLGRRASLRMGNQVPVPSAPRVQDGQVVPAGIQYRDVGTNIDLISTGFADGLYSLEITIEDSSVYGATSNVVDAGTQPTFRAFRSSTNVALRPGESQQFAVATDRVSGEVIRADVTLTVAK